MIPARIPDPDEMHTSRRLPAGFSDFPGLSDPGRKFVVVFLDRIKNFLRFFATLPPPSNSDSEVVFPDFRRKISLPQRRSRKMEKLAFPRGSRDRIGNFWG